MLRFAVYLDGKPANALNLDGAYLVGSDGVPVRAEIEFKKGEIQCRKRTTGPAALAILWPITGGGRMLLETTRLPEREKPYVLQTELLRGRLMRIAQKREDWGLHDFEGTDDIARQINMARDLLVESLTADTLGDAAAMAEKGISVGVTASEMLTTFHAEIFLNRRKQVGGFPKGLFGCRVDAKMRDETSRNRLVEGFQFIALPFNWRQIEPREKELQWDALDNWMEWAIKNRIPVKGSGLVSFAEGCVPDWLYVWEHDFEAIRDLVYEHLRRIIERYGRHVEVWDVVSGIHGNNCFSFNFEQLMELTRMSAAVTKQLAPRAVSVVDLVTPWGEYYATNQRSIPPMLYAEMVLQSGVSFDAFGLHCYFGVAVDGHFVRDLFQISSMLDRFAALGKPVHLTGIQVPSGTSTDPQDAWGGEHSITGAGAWHRDWSEEVQRAWVRRLCHVALSKPFVEAITWRDLADKQPHLIPHGGLLKSDLSPKPAYSEFVAIREELGADPKKPAPAART